MNANPTLKQISDKFSSLQDQIIAGLEKLDGQQKFKQDEWLRPEGGGGRTRIIENGRLLAKGGVNFSHIHGPLPEFLTAHAPGAQKFDVAGISIVLHPHHPFVPIIHMNLRYFETDNGHYWFGGGIDVTPAYTDEAQIRAYHQALKRIGDQTDPALYAEHKKNCDDYFLIKHRDETRGIGGLFFDYSREGSLPAPQLSKGQWFEYASHLGEAFLPIYTQFVNDNQSKKFGESELHWQRVRRGRYVEFNLLYDRGTHFGLQTGGRVESILMSLPPVAEWIYDHHPAPQSPEAKMLEFLKPREWV